MGQILLLVRLLLPLVVDMVDRMVMLMVVMVVLEVGVLVMSQDMTEALPLQDRVMMVVQEE
jgi:hypothetical protein